METDLSNNPFCDLPFEYFDWLDSYLRRESKDHYTGYACWLIRMVDDFFDYAGLERRIVNHAAVGEYWLPLK